MQPCFRISLMAKNTQLHKLGHFSPYFLLAAADWMQSIFPFELILMDAPYLMTDETFTSVWFISLLFSCPLALKTVDVD